MEKLFKYRVYVFISLLVIGGVFFSGYYFGKNHKSQADLAAGIINKTDSSDENVDFAPFWKAWNLINQKYVPTNGTTTEKVDDQTKVYGAIQGMVSSLGDPYTTFFPPVQAKDFNQEISGQLEGVGMEVDVKDGVLTVIAPVKGTPADKAGVKTGDKILKINDTLTSGLTVDQAVNLIRGKSGTTVKITFSRVGTKDPFVVSMIREVINIPNIVTKSIGDVFYIQLSTFSATSPDLFRDALRTFVESGKYKLIIDLRGNPGGYLEAAQDIASWFLPAGKVVVSEDFLNSEDNQVFRSKGYNIFNDKLKLAILIDGGSASASEILAGALHDQGVATLVGTQSFGKGSVQELINITDDTSLKVTVAKWLTPNGISISHQGLTPDVVIPLDEKAFLATTSVDTQLNKALEILSK